MGEVDCRRLALDGERETRRMFSWPKPKQIVFYVRGYNNFHPLSKCYQFKKLSVEDRVEVVKRNNLCFRCFLPHRLKECRSEKNCFCLRPHNSLIHFSCDKTRNPTPTSNLNLDAPTFVPGQIEESVEANSQSQFVATGFEKGRLKKECVF
ncbi:DUF1758 domain-containing protein [Trichonephila clavipes]|nr:DUF1758 domain-containing protein [Trichonephila clavipes]